MEDNEPRAWIIVRTEYEAMKLLPLLMNDYVYMGSKIWVHVDLDEERARLAYEDAKKALNNG